MAFNFPNLTPGVPYLGAAQVKAYVQDWWLDDVAAVSYQVVDERRPLYGFRNNYWSAVSQGQTLVSGQLICLFRYPGYLARLLDKLLSPEEKTRPKVSEHGVPLTAKLLASGQTDIQNLLKELSVKSRGQFQQVSQNLKDLFHRPQKQAPSVPVRPAEQQTQKNKRFDLRLIYGWSEDGVSQRFEQAIQDVYLTGQSHQFSALNGEGDTVLLEAYDFIGRNVIVR